MTVCANSSRRARKAARPSGFLFPRNFRISAMKPSESKSRGFASFVLGLSIPCSTLSQSSKSRIDD